jgi:hypothetical protein
MKTEIPKELCWTYDDEQFSSYGTITGFKDSDDTIESIVMALENAYPNKNIKRENVEIE